MRLMTEFIGMDIQRLRQSALFFCPYRFYNLPSERRMMYDSKNPFEMAMLDLADNMCLVIDQFLERGMFAGELDFDDAFCKLFSIKTRTKFKTFKMGDIYILDHLGSVCCVVDDVVCVRNSYVNDTVEKIFNAFLSILIDQYVLLC